ncbi:MAG: hypothetical protein KBA06_02590 [Saprospiraceae bacterium]|nr:hypothetical protein [Saprospiraceae bacterium]
MKKKIITSLLLIFVFMSANAQNQIWYEGFFGIAGQFNFYTYTCNTKIINGKEYQLLWQIDLNSTTVQSKGLLRKEGLKIYHKNNDNAPEVLQYDFGMNLGDTMTYITNFGLDVNVKVIQKDIVNVAGISRVRLIVEYSPFAPILFQETWIEDVGSEKGLLSRLSEVTDYSPFLSCYYENRIFAYSYDDVTNQCITNINLPECEVNDNHETNNIQTTQIIYPNIIIDQDYVVAPDYLNKSFELLNAQSQKVKSGNLKMDNSFFDALSNGIYFLVIKNEYGHIFAVQKILLNQ